MIITICASVDFSPRIIKIKNFFEKRNNLVNIPYFTKMMIDGDLTYQQYMDTKEKGGDIALRMDQDIDFFKRYWNYIADSDAVLVLNLQKNGINGYIGGNTLVEMGFAHIAGTKLYLFNPIPKRSERMHYVDELEDLKPTVINGDLSLIN